jgi:hypothetical protein
MRRHPCRHATCESRQPSVRLLLGSASCRPARQRRCSSSFRSVAASAVRRSRSTRVCRAFGSLFMPTVSSSQSGTYQSLLITAFLRPIASPIPALCALFDGCGRVGRQPSFSFSCHISVRMYVLLLIRLPAPPSAARSTDTVWLRDPPRAATAITPAAATRGRGPARGWSRVERSARGRV